MASQPDGLSEVDWRLLAIVEATMVLGRHATVESVVDLLVETRWRRRNWRRPRIAGRLRKVPSSAVFALIGEAVRAGLLERRAGWRSVDRGIAATAAGVAALQGAPRRSRHPKSPDPDPALLAGVFAWREQAARLRGVHPRRLISDGLLLRIVRLHPFTWSDLLQLDPLRRRPQRLLDWGESLLDCIFALAPPTGGDFVPEDDSGVPLPFTNGWALDVYGDDSLGFRQRTRVGDAVFLYTSRAQSWVAELLAPKMAQLFAHNDNGRSPVQGICNVVALADAAADAATWLLARRVAEAFQVDDLTTRILHGPCASLSAQRVLLVDLVADGPEKLALAARCVQDAGLHVAGAVAAAITARCATGV